MAVSGRSWRTGVGALATIAVAASGYGLTGSISAAAAGDEISVTVTCPAAVAGCDGRSVTLDLTEVPLNDASFEVVLHDAGGGFSDITADYADELPSYLGTVRGEPSAYAAATRMGDGSLWAQVVFDGRLTWRSIDDAVVDTRGAALNDAFSVPTQRWMTSDLIGSQTYQAVLGADLSSAYLDLFDGSVSRAMDMVRYTYTTTRAIYLHQAGVDFRIGRVVVRGDEASDPYRDQQTGTQLSTVRDQWAVGGPVASDTADLVQMFSGGDSGGGLGYITQLGSAYSVNGSSTRRGQPGTTDDVLRHEVGHNWNVTDHHGGPFDPSGTGTMAPGPEGGTIESGNDYARWDLSEIYAVGITKQRRILDGTLDAIGPWSATDLPPTPVSDMVETVAGRAPITIDPTSNDHSATGREFEVSDVDPVSALGQPVELVADGTLRYTPPSQPTSEVDHFSYEITDTDGRTGTAEVILTNGSPFQDIEAEDPSVSADPSVGGGSNTDMYYWGSDVRRLENAGEYVEWTLDQQFERDVRLQLRYTTYDETEPQVQVSVDGVPLGAPITLKYQGRRLFQTIELPTTLAAGSHRVRVTYTREATGVDDVDLDRLRVITADEAPVLSAAGLAPARVGQAYAADLAARSDDPDLPDDELSHTLIDGPPWAVVAPDGTLSGTPGAGDVGIAEFTVRVSDAYGLIDTEVVRIEVLASQDPVAGGPYTIDEGEDLRLAASGPGSDSVTWDLDADADFDDASGAQAVVGAEQLADLGLDGPYAGTVTARFGAAGQDAQVTAELRIANLAPRAFVLGPDLQPLEQPVRAVAGEPLRLKVGAEDPSPLDAAGLFDYRVDWGDDSPAQTLRGPADPPVEHTFAAAGTYTAIVTATDADGAESAPVEVAIAVTAAGSEPGIAAGPQAETRASGDRVGALPTTGASLGAAALLGGVLVGLGCGSLLTRRRSARATPR